MDGIKKENDCFIRKHHKWSGVVGAASVHLGEFENQSTQLKRQGWVAESKKKKTNPRGKASSLIEY
jgi:hypothetical protein